MICILILLAFFISYNNPSPTSDSLACTQNNNLSYDYFNKTTNEVTHKDSKIPIYIECKNDG